MKQRGFTLPELLIVLYGVALVAGAAGIVYAVVHFVGKYW